MSAHRYDIESVPDDVIKQALSDEPTDDVKKSAKIYSKEKEDYIEAAPPPYPEPVIPKLGRISRKPVPNATTVGKDGWSIGNVASSEWHPENRRSRNNLFGLSKRVWWILLGVLVVAVLIGTITGITLGIEAKKRANSQASASSTLSLALIAGSTSPPPRTTTSSASFLTTSHPATEALTYTVTALLYSYASNARGFTEKYSTATTVVPLSLSTPTSTLSSVLPSGSLECPAANGTYYSPGEAVANKTTQVFQKLCNVTLPRPPSGDDYWSYLGFDYNMNSCIDRCALDNANYAPNLTCSFVHWEYDDYQKQRPGGWPVLCGLVQMAPFDWIMEGGDEAAVLVAYDPIGGVQS